MLMYGRSLRGGREGRGGRGFPSWEELRAPRSDGPPINARSVGEITKAQHQRGIPVPYESEMQVEPMYSATALQLLFTPSCMCLTMPMVSPIVSIGQSYN